MCGFTCADNFASKGLVTYKQFKVANIQRNEYMCMVLYSLRCAVRSCYTNVNVFLFCDSVWELANCLISI